MSEIPYTTSSGRFPREHLETREVEDDELDARLDEVRFALGALRDAYESGTLVTDTYDTPKSPFLDPTWFENEFNFRLGKGRLVLGLDKTQDHEISPLAIRRKIIAMIAKAYRKHHAVQKAIIAWGEPLTSGRRKIKGLPYEYVREMKSYPVLSSDEEEALFDKIEDGFTLYLSLDSPQNISQETHEVFASLTIARLFLSLSHARMVIDMAKDLSQGRRMPTGLIDSGNIELLTVIDGYEPGSTRSLKEIAHPQIGQTMVEFIDRIPKKSTSAPPAPSQKATRPKVSPQEDLEKKIRSTLRTKGFPNL